jgi:preprotein translocase subunit SecE
MARDRQRAKRRRRTGAGPGPGPGTTRLHRENVPGELDHASGEVEEFEAAIVAGAEGVSEEPVVEDLDAELDVETAPDPGEDALADAVPATAAQPPVRQPVAPPSVAREPLGEEDDDSSSALVPARGKRPAPHPARPAAAAGGNRAVAFLRASWAELQRVQWPDRRQVAQATGVVIGFVLIAGAYLGIADWAAQKIVDFIL